MVERLDPRTVQCESTELVAVHGTVSEHEELKRRFALESAARKKYYNEVLEMKGKPPFPH